MHSSILSARFLMVPNTCSARKLARNFLRFSARSTSINSPAHWQYHIRKSIIRLLKSGKSGRETARLLDVSEGHVSNVKKAYAEGGLKGIQIGQRGRRVGTKRVLTPEQEQDIRQILVDKTPDQLQFKECMWSRAVVRAYIRREYGLNMGLSTLGYYLNRWGFSAQRPTKRAYKRFHGAPGAGFKQEGLPHS